MAARKLVITAETYSNRSHDDTEFEVQHDFNKNRSTDPARNDCDVILFCWRFDNT